MSGRKEFLERITKALGHAPGSPAETRHPGLGFPDLRPVLPPIAPANLVTTFEEELQKVSGHAHRVPSTAGLHETLHEILKGQQGKRVVLSRNPLLAQFGVAQRLEGLGIEVTVWPAGRDEPTDPVAAQRFREEAFTAEVGITGVDWALAESGTLVLSSLTEGAQLASLAPPVHVALYRRSQVLGSLEEVLERLPGLGDPSAPAPGRSVVFVTGVSRTADIEQILIRGVHGPRELHAILVEETCFT